jgi:hypothetical protein
MKTDNSNNMIYLGLTPKYATFLDKLLSKASDFELLDPNMLEEGLKHLKEKTADKIPNEAIEQMEADVREKFAERNKEITEMVNNAVMLRAKLIEARERPSEFSGIDIN